MRVIAFLLALGFIIHYFWWIVGAVLLWVVVWFIHDVAHQFVTRRAIEVAQRHALIARCDQQHAWVMAGDERGIYGGTADPLLATIYQQWVDYVDDLKAQVSEGVLELEAAAENLANAERAVAELKGALEHGVR